MSAWWWLAIFVGAVVVACAVLQAGAEWLFNHVDQPKRDETAPDPGAPGGTS